MPSKAPAATSASALRLREEICSALRNAEADARDLGHLLDRVQARAPATKRKSPTSGRGEDPATQQEELKAAVDKMEQHRALIQKWSTSCRSLDSEVRSKLAAARTHIDTELRKARSFGVERREVKEHERNAPEQKQDVESQDALVPALVSAPADSVETKAEEEVKVLVEQMEVEGEGSDMTSEFVCKICLVHMVGCQPKLTSCSHLFCGDCIAKWFSMHRGNQSWAGRMKSAGAVPCPVCKEPLCAESDLHSVSPDGQGGSLLLWNLLASTKVKCVNHPACNPNGQCDWVGDYGSYQQHLKTCTNNACAAVPRLPAAPEASPVERAELETHTINAEVLPEICARSDPQDKLEAVIDSEPETQEPASESVSETEEAPPTSSLATDEGTDSESEDTLPPSSSKKSLTDLIGALLELRRQQHSGSEESSAAASQPSVSPTAPEPISSLPAPMHKDDNEQETQPFKKKSVTSTSVEAAWAAQASRAAEYQARVHAARMAQWQYARYAQAQAQMAYASRVAQWQVAQAQAQAQWQSASRAAWAAQQASRAR